VVHELPVHLALPAHHECGAFVIDLPGRA
jgi:hypothetical protein